MKKLKPKLPIKLFDLQLWQWDVVNQTETHLQTSVWNSPYALCKSVERTWKYNHNQYPKIKETKYSKDRRKHAFESFIVNSFMSYPNGTCWHRETHRWYRIKGFKLVPIENIPIKKKYD